MEEEFSGGDQGRYIGKYCVFYSGEKQLREVKRFHHDGLIRFDVSPQENYLVTFVPKERSIRQVNK